RSERERRAKPIEFDDIYAILEDTSKGTPLEWGERYRTNPAYETYVTAPLGARGATATAARAAAGEDKARPPAPKRVSAWRQFRILSSRNLKILTRDRFSLILMLALPPLIAMIDVIISIFLSRTPFDFVEGSINDVGITLFMLTVYGVMVGGMAQMREIAKENDVYRRERLVNLQIFPYVLSKFWVAAILALYQAIWYIGIHYLAFEMPGGITEFMLIYVTLTLATMAGMVLGLFSSAVSPTANAVPLILILFLLPQFVLGGALVPVPDYVSAPTSTRWAFEALMAISGAGSDVAADACWALPPELRDSMSLEDREEQCNCMGPNMLDEDSCQFPGLGAFYNEAIDQTAPDEPPPFRDPPPEPEVPPPPPEPEDQSDAVAVADYLKSLEEYQTTVEGIQADYKAALETYQAEAEIYQAEYIAYQEELIGWQIDRSKAVEPAEATIELFDEKFGWTYVDKNDTQTYYAKVVRTWIGQLAIITVLFIGILLVQKRKDAV
ncbi:MAG: ABC transporter permease, partial [Anaerolineales bacterium]|nr:ABC transporter permease [Anaerolineales bacterium]